MAIQNKIPKVPLKQLFNSAIAFLKNLLSLEEDTADEKEIIASIKKGVEFKGTNIWVLVFAIFIASIGLNVNSTAVVIGAMLISPLMGPIMGVGLGVAIYDFSLIKKAFLNLSIAATISVITSWLYFVITPLQDAQSELLARSTPTLYDVLIALMGGFAGIVAVSRREKSNAIPGVAIATALMPPLCTAGYGLATLNAKFFFGAFYLFIINCVFISFSTIVIVRYLKIKRTSFVDEKKEKSVKFWTTTVLTLVILPSIYIAFTVIQKSIYERNAKRFIEQEMVFENAQVINQKIKHKASSDGHEIDITLFGEIIPEDYIQNTRIKLKNYGLEDTKLIVHQGAFKNASNGVDATFVEKMNQNLKTGIIEDLYKKNEEIIQNKDHKIEILEKELIKYRSTEIPYKDIAREAKAQYKDLREMSISNSILTNLNEPIRNDTVCLVCVKFKRYQSKREMDRLEKWLKVRTKADSLKVVVEQP